MAIRIVGPLFFFLGLVFLAAAGYLAFGQYNSVRSARAEGVLVLAGNQPIVQFTAPDGAIVRFSKSVRSSYDVPGNHVTVAFNPQNPTDAEIYGFSGNWFLPIILGFMGSVFTIVGVVAMILTRRLRG